MTLSDQLQTYARALAEKHKRRFLRFSLANAANDNRSVLTFHHSESTSTTGNPNNVPC